MINKYYIYRASCKAHNKKTQELAEYLKKFSRIEVQFSESFTPQDLLREIKDFVFRINSQHRGRDIDVVMHDFAGNINIVFSDNPKSGECVANIVLNPIDKTIVSL